MSKVVPSDIEIAQASKMKPVMEIATSCGIFEDEVELYGNYKAKISLDALERLKDKEDGKLVLVTAINPTPAGEGKSTTTIGLGQALNKIGKKTIVALREPSLGPVFGVKGGAAGGGYSQVVPMEDINLHFTGDMHAITAANNLLAAAIDNHIHQGNSLNIDVRNIVWKRVIDMNDRALRDIIVSLGGKANGFPREEAFMITVASEVMAILCLSTSLEDLKRRCGEIIVAYDLTGNPVRCRDLKVQGAMALLMKDAIKPNLVQTLENTPAFIHGGPFANIAHGCNSILATRLALKIGDYCVTEAGFGADLGGEKFLDIKCRYGGLTPSAVVIVTTVRALKHNGGVAKVDLNKENIDALKQGFPNLERHVSNISKFGIPAMVAINKFYSDTDDEINALLKLCSDLGVKAVVNNCFTDGGEGGIEMAEELVKLVDSSTPNFKHLYPDEMPLQEKIETIVKEIYGGDGIIFEGKSKKQLETIEALGFGNLPICMAKTQYSLTGDSTIVGAPKGFKVTIKAVRVSSGAGFVVCEAGDIMTMPGLPKLPSYEKIDIDEDGTITGLF